jgi:photosystem II stability/assembly factor-like uncharacterized protein
MKKILLTITCLCAVVLSHAQWTQHNPPHTDSSYLFSIQVPNANTVWAHSVDVNSAPAIAVGGSMNYLRTADGGNTWNFDSIPPTDSLELISNFAAIDADTAYVATGAYSTFKGYLYKTTNGGQSWAPSLYSFSWIDNVYFWNAAEGITISDPQGNDFAIKTTPDGGFSWPAVPNNNIPNRLTNEYGYCNRYAVAGNHVWFAAYGGNIMGAVSGVRIFHSADKGLHWVANGIIDSTSIPGLKRLPGGIDDMAFIDSLHGFVVQRIGTFLNPTLWFTVDGGNSWEKRDTITGTYYAQYLATVPGTTTLFSSSSGPYHIGSSYSNDFGYTWQSVDTGDAYGHSAMAFLNDTLGWGGEYKNSASSFGGIFKWGTTPTAVNNLTNPEISVSVFPNPAANLVYVKVTKANNQPVQLTLTDETGRMVFENNYTSTDNFFMRSINISSLSKGLYFVSIQVGENRYTQKLLHTF